MAARRLNLSGGRLRWRAEGHTVEGGSTKANAAVKAA